MTTALTLINEARGYLRDGTDNSGSSLFSNDEFLGYLNRSIDNLCYETDINYRPYEYIVNTSNLTSANQVPILTITGGVESELFDLDLLSYRNSGETETAIRDLRVVNQKGLHMNSTNSFLKVVSIYDDILHFNVDLVGNGTSATSDLIIVSGKWKKASLTQTNNTYPLGAACEYASVAYMVTFGLYKKSQMDAGDRWFQVFESRKKLINDNTSNSKDFDNPGGLSLNKRTIETGYSYTQRRIGT